MRRNHQGARAATGSAGGAAGLRERAVQRAVYASVKPLGLESRFPPEAVFVDFGCAFLRDVPESGVVECLLCGGGRGAVR